MTICKVTYLIFSEHFPYFRTAPPGWKNSVRHNLSLNKGFLKIEKSETNLGSGTKKGFLWALNPDKSVKMYDEITKWLKKDPQGIKLGMARPGADRNPFVVGSFLTLNVSSLDLGQLGIEVRMM